MELASARALSPADARRIADSCRKAGTELIPLFNCLGHQSWAKTTFPLLARYAEFDETPGNYPENEGIYCRSWCPRHPRLHDVVFALIDGWWLFRARSMPFYCCYNFRKK